MVKDRKHTYQSLIGLIDQAINAQVNEIIHHPHFQALESSWRGVDMLVCHADKHPQIIIKLLSLSHSALNKSLNMAIEFDQSDLFQRIYTDEFDQPGGTPFGLIIGDYYFSHRTHHKSIDDISLLGLMAKVCAAAFSPFVSAASAHLFGLDNFHHFTGLFKLDNLFTQREYQRFLRLKKDPDTRFIGLTLPRVLMRRPINHQGVYLQNTHFVENIDSSDDYLWGNAAYAYGCVAINAYIESGWFAKMRGIDPEEQQGAVVSLTRDYYATENNEKCPKFISEYHFTDNQEKSLTDAGFMAIKDNPAIKKAIFYGGQSLNQPLNYTKPIAKVNAKISCLLPYILCASRFAHYIKVIIRDKVGSFISATDCEQFLQKWLLHYTADNQTTHAANISRFPLRKARVSVKAHQSLPGNYYCTLYLQPQYQLDEIHSQLKLITRIKL